MKNHEQLLHREEIMEFCRNFINGDNKHLHDVIDNYRHLFSQIDIKQINLTQETFDITFKNVKYCLIQDPLVALRFRVNIKRVLPIILLLLV